MKARPRLTAVLFLASVFLMSPVDGSASAKHQSFPSRPSQSNLAASSPSDPDDVQSFFDDEIAAELSRNQIPGAISSVITERGLIFAGGYGSADPDKSVPVDADETVFRIGSQTKLFVWTAIMQLYEQGKLDLNTDVNTYLETFRIPDTYSEPITVTNLMTHTAGFEDSNEDVLAREESDIQPLGSWLASHIPARVRPPGKVTAYSNYGAGLAGYIVERVSGRPWDQYVEESILAPLDMDRTTFRQPLPQELAEDTSNGFSYSSETKVEEFAYVQHSPAGSGNSTATDMANFALAHLNEGAFGDAQILENSTARLMHSQLFTNDPDLPGMTYGFVEQTINGHRIISHGGDIGGFSSTLFLLPDEGVGVFASYNSASGHTAREELIQAFMDRYYPPSPAEPVGASAEGTTSRAAKIAGSYWSTRRPYKSFEKLVGPTNAIEIHDEGDGHIQIDMGDKSGYGKVDLVETAPWRFEQTNGEGIGRVVFHVDADGEVSQMLLGNLPIFAYTKMAWYETLTFNLILLGLAGLVFVSALFFWPGHWLWRRVQGKRHVTGDTLQAAKAGRRSSGASLVFWIALIGCALYVVTVLLLILSLGADIYGRPESLDAVFVMVWIALGLAVLTVLGVGVAWVRRYWSPLQRVHESVLALGMVAVGWQFIFWNIAVL
jgi:CubicO group peptidase (beta-lactamase class C family)